MTPNWRRNSTPGAPRRPTASPPSPFARADRLLAPGSTIGILGGGQLGRMLAVAAAQLGYRTHVYSPDRESVAAQVAAPHSQDRKSTRLNSRHQCSYRMPTSS